MGSIRHGTKEGYEPLTRPLTKDTFLKAYWEPVLHKKRSIKDSKQIFLGWE